MIKRQRETHMLSGIYDGDMAAGIIPRCNLPRFAFPFPKITLPISQSRFCPRKMDSLSAVSSGGDSKASEKLANSVPEDSSSDTLVQYVVLCRDLIDSWPLGSVVTQCCHATAAAVWSYKDDPFTLQYCSNLDSMHKVCLEVKGEIQLRNLSDKLIEGGIDHKLWIEQPEDVPTSLATKPYPKSVVSSFFKRLKLCK